MTNLLLFKFKPFVTSVYKNSLDDDEIVILFDEGDSGETKLYFDEQNFLSLYYKIRYFVEKNFYGEKEKVDKEFEEFCLTGKVPKIQFQSTIEEMRKFLYSMTIRDAGLFKKESSMANLFQDNGDSANTKDTSTTSSKENG